LEKKKLEEVSRKVTRDVITGMSLGDLKMPQFCGAGELP
jgi:hypothetical protein